MKPTLCARHLSTLLFIACLSITNLVHSAVYTLERDALAALYDSTARASWTDNTNNQNSVISDDSGVAATTSGTKTISTRPKRGMWWNLERPGHGIDLQMSGSMLFIVWYTYLPDGSPIWYLAVAEYQEGAVWTATLERFSWDSVTRVATPTAVGTLSMDFADDEHGTLSWTLNGENGSELFERYIANEDSPEVDFTGHWYPPSDSGWGLTVVTQGTVEFTVLYFYDLLGRPVWGLGVVDGEATKSAVPLDIYSGFCPSCAALDVTYQALGSIEHAFDTQTSGMLDVDIAQTAVTAGWTLDLDWTVVGEQISMISDPISSVFQDCADCPLMANIPGGTFEMGDISGAGSSSELPVHTVNIPAFAMGVYEVTFDEWDACYADSGCSHNPSDGGYGRGTRPVIDVRWNDAQEYVTWLNSITGKSYRLPSESEWEYAARAGTTTDYWWGNDIGVNNANCYPGPCGDSFPNTAPAGSFAANSFGLFDVHGNVREWTEDCWNTTYAGAPSDGSAWLTGDCALRVVRSGSWGSNPLGVRSAYRFGTSASQSYYSLGFRVAQDQN